MSAPAKSVGRSKSWTRATIIKSIRRWYALYGDVPRQADLNPSAAKWAGATWRIERYHAGDPETGARWPSANAVKAEFDGSFSAAIEAAGFEATKPGPPSRRAAASPELDLDRLEAHPLVRMALDGALAEARDAGRTLEVRERQLARAREVTEGLREQLDAAKRARPARVRTRTRTKTKTKVVREGDPRAEARARAAADKAAERVTELTAELKDERKIGTRLAARLERAEATINTLRGERRELKADLDQAGRDRVRAEDRLVAAERLAAREPEIRTVVKDAPEQAEIDTALAEAAEARRRSMQSETRTAAAERRMRELAALVTGEERVLTPAEIDELRTRGAAGPSVMAGAIKELAKARATDDRPALKRALRRVASAAVTWMERIP